MGPPEPEPEPEPEPVSAPLSIPPSAPEPVAPVRTSAPVSMLPPAQPGATPLPKISTRSPRRNFTSEIPTNKGPSLWVIAGLGGAVLIVVGISLYEPKERPAPENALGTIASDTTGYRPPSQENLIPPPPTSVEKKVPPKRVRKAEGRTTRREPGPTAEVPPLENVLADAGASMNPVSGKPDPQIEEALEQIADGVWPQDEWIRRKAMIAVIFALRPDMKSDNWPNVETPFHQLQSVFIQNLQSLKYSDIAKKLAATPIPAPVSSASR